MPVTPATPEPADLGDREGRDTTGFTRVVNLSDAVFAIAMTLLVLTVDVPRVPADELAGALLADLPQLGAYVLAFALVASQWYAHRKLFERFAFTEPGLTVVNLVALGLVALVPFPTSVLGNYPTTTAAVAPFLAIFVALSLAYIAMIVRAHTVTERPAVHRARRDRDLDRCGTAHAGAPARRPAQRRARVAALKAADPPRADQCACGRAGLRARRPRRSPG